MMNGHINTIYIWNMIRPDKKQRYSKTLLSHYLFYNLKFSKIKKKILLHYSFNIITRNAELFPTVSLSY